MTGAATQRGQLGLQLDVDYTTRTDDACFAWLRHKYRPLLFSCPESSSNEEDETKCKKPRLDLALLQAIENDVAACDVLRWRVFSFPSHPTQPLSTSYRNAPGKTGAPGSVMAAVHKTNHIEKRKAHEGKSRSGKNGTTTSTGTTTAEEKAETTVVRSRHTVIIDTRAGEDARKKAKAAKSKSKPSTGSAGTPLGRMEAVMEKILRDDRQAHWCKVLGEEDARCHPSTGATAVNGLALSESTTSWWSQRWMPQCWRPLLGGYVSVPTRVDTARFLLFPQSTHASVDWRDPDDVLTSSGAVLTGSQPVSFFARGGVTWNAEEHNPAAGPVTAPPDGAHGLHYTVQYAQVAPAAVPGKANWADLTEVTLAAQQTRTERQYAPERKKVQRVSLMESRAAIRVSEGDPRYSMSLDLGQSTVLNSGIKHQHSADSSPEVSTMSRKQRRAAQSAVHAQDDRIHRVQVQDEYDSSVQNFALPWLWQRLVWPSLFFVEAPTAGTETKALEEAPRGQYRLRWTAGPGLEVCRPGNVSLSNTSTTAMISSSQSLFTIFGRLWSESWVELPLPWRMSLKLRNQSAMVMPLEPQKLRLPSMISDTTSSAATSTNGASNGSPHVSIVLPMEEEAERPSRLCEHPYFWATQGPKWDASLVRGFKNDYSGMHHARRWYSIFSAEVTLSGASSEKKFSKARVTAATKPAEVDASTDEEVITDNSAAAILTTASAPPAVSQVSRWRNTSLTAFANACVVDTFYEYPRASVGFSFASQIPRLSFTPFNEVIPHKFECAFSWFAAFKRTTPEAAEQGFRVEWQSGVQPTGEAAVPVSAEGLPFLRVSPVETFQHMKCGLTWRFDE